MAENKLDEQDVTIRQFSQECPKCERMSKAVTKGERITAICIIVAFLALMGLLAWASVTSDMPPTENVEWMMP